MCENVTREQALLSAAQVPGVPNKNQARHGNTGVTARCLRSGGTFQRSRSGLRERAAESPDCIQLCTTGPCSRVAGLLLLMSALNA